MRKQYYFRSSERGLLAWDVDRLVRLTAGLPRVAVPLRAIRELDEPWPAPAEAATWRGLIEHLELIEAADLSYPIILSATGAVMDGMHRVVRAVREGRTHVEAARFVEDPEPDYVGLGPEDLPY